MPDPGTRLPVAAPHPWSIEQIAFDCIAHQRIVSEDTQQISPEPVLATLVQHIRNDEVGHYEYFYHFFLRYREIERPSRWQVARVVRQRLEEIGQENAYLALKNAFAVRNPGQTFSPQDFEGFQRTAGRWARADYPYEMTV